MIIISYYILLLFHEFTLTYFHNLLSNLIGDIIIITVIIITTTSIINTVDITDDLSNFTSSIEVKKLMFS